MIYSHQSHEQTPIHEVYVFLPSCFTIILSLTYFFHISVQFVCFRHARDYAAPQFSAVSRESKDATEETTKLEPVMQETQEEVEEEQDTDSAEDFFSCSEDE